MYDGQILILSFNVEHTSSRQGYKKIQNNFPAELDLFGIIKFGECTDAQAHLNDILQVRGCVFTYALEISHKLFETRAIFG